MQPGEQPCLLDASTPAAAAYLPAITAASPHVALTDGASHLRVTLCGRRLSAPGTTLVARCGSRQLFLPVRSFKSGRGDERAEAWLPLSSLPAADAATGAQIVWLEAALGAYLSAAVPLLVVKDANVAADAAGCVARLLADNCSDDVGGTRGSSGGADAALGKTPALLRPALPPAPPAAQPAAPVCADANTCMQSVPQWRNVAAPQDTAHYKGGKVAGVSAAADCLVPRASTSVPPPHACDGQPADSGEAASSDTDSFQAMLDNLFGCEGLCAEHTSA